MPSLLASLRRETVGGCEVISTTSNTYYAATLVRVPPTRRVTPPLSGQEGLDAPFHSRPTPVYALHGPRGRRRTRALYAMMGG